jgi:hypothetical protein
MTAPQPPEGTKTMDSHPFAKMVPGFDFMQQLMRGAAAPPMGQWVAPTLDPKEIEKRIGELKTVQFWLEQNARMIAATVQALEVQRMTLSTLESMNLPLAGLPGNAGGDQGSDAPAAVPGLADAMNWWVALTQQFGELAGKAMQDSGADIASRLSAAAPAPRPRAAKAPRTKR